MGKFFEKQAVGFLPAFRRQVAGAGNPDMQLGKQHASTLVVGGHFRLGKSGMVVGIVEFTCRSQLACMESRVSDPSAAGEIRPQS